MAIEIKKVPVHKSENGVWMLEGQGVNSAARVIAVEAMRALKHDTNDFRKRDAVIDAIYETIEWMLDYVAEHNVYRDAMDSMAAQMIHPKMTGLEMAKMQLGVQHDMG